MSSLRSVQVRVGYRPEQNLGHVWSHSYSGKTRYTVPRLTTGRVEVLRGASPVSSEGGWSGDKRGSHPTEPGFRTRVKTLNFRCQPTFHEVSVPRVRCVLQALLKGVRVPLSTGTAGCQPERRGPHLLCHSAHKSRHFDSRTDYVRAGESVRPSSVTTPAGGSCRHPDRHSCDRRRGPGPTCVECARRILSPFRVETK